MTPKKYMSEVVKEGKRIRWPKRDVLIPTIIVVVLIAGIAALFLSLEDLAAGRLIQILKDAFGGN
ncbi:MAG: preprotein translocase subunit SecE [Bacilli bacterium]|nr:preprotein translocase subunit SecE [Bacilli bacterium]MDY6391301.1 preprotein translocase subunit SecE [Bacilli bacterium]